MHDDGRPPVVLHVVTRFLGGGSEQRITDIVDALPAAEHRLLVGDIDELGLGRCPVPPDQVEVDRALVRELRPHRDGPAVRNLVGRLRRERVDVVVTHQSKAGVVGRLAARRRGIPCVHSLSMTSFGDGYSALGSAVYRSVEKHLARWTAAYGVVGHDLADRYAAIGVPPEKLHVVRSRVRLPSASGRAAARAALARDQRFDGDRPVVAFVGSLEPRKGVDDLPELLALVRARPSGRDAVLAVAGDGPGRPALAAALGDRGLAAHARLAGHVPDVSALFLAADVVVLPSRAEGLPQVLVQASAAGTPFVASDVCGVGELLRAGAAGTTHRPGDVAAAAAAVDHWLRQPRRPPAVDLTEWDPEVIHRSWSDVISPLVEGDRARPG